ncbi:ArsA family ATPase [Metabacillus iocasae]|uniref:Arsenite-transporting ATPase n=1 Tax=Priestia iocasae TaxID=2291674 RepID=A0ABS2QWB7_9BACI|nr:ArsA family ATPase [Metabacillus iocasae]MBM7703761.1 arsenite-transporting ATPase [Metabacillus iocasae]
MDLLQKRIIFVGGKGGVGKSTTASALAYLLSTKGNRVLLVSTDPAHNIGDVFHVQAKKEIVRIHDTLDLLEIDSHNESKRYINSVKENLKGLVKATMIDEVNRQIDLASASPGADEAALFDRITSLILTERHRYDKIVFDTAPTGHTLRLLTLPELMNVWINGLLERRKKVQDNYTQLLNDGEPIEDPIYEKLQERKKKFTAVRDVLLDSAITGYAFVLNAERLPILETKKAVHTLSHHQIHVSTVIVNKIIPAHADGAFMQRRRECEQPYLEEIHTSFTKQQVITLPLFEHDISTLTHLQAFSTILEEAFSMYVNK